MIMGGMVNGTHLGKLEELLFLGTLSKNLTDSKLSFCLAILETKTYRIPNYLQTASFTTGVCPFDIVQKNV